MTVQDIHTRTGVAWLRLTSFDKNTCPHVQDIWTLRNQLPGMHFLRNLWIMHPRNGKIPNHIEHVTSNVRQPISHPLSGDGCLFGLVCCLLSDIMIDPSCKSRSIQPNPTVISRYQLECLRDCIHKISFPIKMHNMKSYLQTPEENTQNFTKKKTSKSMTQEDLRH